VDGPGRGPIVSAAETAERCCAVCGASLDGRRPQALYCSGACRADASRLRRLLSGQEVDGYRSVWDFLLNARKNRTDRQPETAAV
jgi:hypothetical protein